MPIRGNPFIKGDLFIKFTVRFPKPGSIPAAAMLSLSTALRGAEEGSVLEREDEDAEGVTLTELNVDLINERERQMRMDDATDEDDSRGQQQHVQCAQQ